ncbi:sialin-like [Schistocerca piceifrons]|uniref:sialin-like n=1 Tax=Schistocerca piceifrons TaxID=274613 RepID=UPI001F5E51DA|nr:sialin-like [Schistocerca piceifrons]
MVKTNTSSDSSDDGTIDACPATESNAGDGNKTQTTGDFDWDAQTQAEVLASYYYGYVATQLLGGFLGEKYGARYICGPGLFIAGLLTVVSPWTAYVNTYFFMVVRALEGAASGVVVPSLQSLVSKWFPPEERTRLSGVIFSALNLGSVLSMGLSGILAAAGGWPLVFYFFGALAVVWFIPWIFLIYDSPDKHPRISEEEKEYILSSLGEELNAKKVAPPVPWLQLLTSVPVWTAIIFHTGTAWTMFTLLSEMPTYLKTVLHFDIAQSGLLSALPYVFCWVFGSAFGWLSQWIRGKGYLSHLAAYRVFNAVAGIGPAVAFIIITFVGCNSSVIVVLLIITTTTNSALYGGSYLNHMDLARNFAGTISGLLHTVVTSCGIFAPLAVGALINENTLNELDTTSAAHSELCHSNSDMRAANDLLHSCIAETSSEFHRAQQELPDDEDITLASKQVSEGDVMLSESQLRHFKTSERKSNSGYWGVASMALAATVMWGADWRVVSSGGAQRAIWPGAVRKHSCSRRSHNATTTCACFCRILSR